MIRGLVRACGTRGVNRPGLVRFCSHPDFAEKSKVPNDEEMLAEMKEDIKSNPVVLFMKGDPGQPRCGFSAKVASILQPYNVKYICYDVLADQRIRDGVKRISNWPTIPQLFVDGEFVGGCDIVTELHRTGELKELIGKYAKDK
eukprot:TRINITY_DN116401_c0_g1_i1.p2 TRINITY_DN116401_c0_g1~~TRINITY_DN116401_c0_g1_i1.p2  ORF type:complete len:144 (-),score=18.63 TRINITY_DN116401_c0_g1_i1:121-552(-)